MKRRLKIYANECTLFMNAWVFVAMLAWALFVFTHTMYLLFHKLTVSGLFGRTVRHIRIVWMNTFHPFAYNFYICMREMVIRYEIICLCVGCHGNARRAVPRTLYSRCKILWKSQNDTCVFEKIYGNDGNGFSLY